MASSQVCETAVAFINGDDEVRGMEVLEINGALLMSLMEESPSDESECDDRLNSLMRSFEAEIMSGSNIKMDGHDSTANGSGLASDVGEDTQSWNMGHVDGQDHWDSSSGDEFGVEWVDMDFMPSSPYIDPYGDEKDEITMANNLKMYEGYAMEEHGYNSFWQDTYNLVRCE